MLFKSRSEFCAAKPKGSQAPFQASLMERCSDLNNTDFSNINPINQDIQEFEDNAYEKSERLIDRYNKTKSEIKDQIDYDALILSSNKELINDIVEVMTDVMVVDTPYYTVGKKEIRGEQVIGVIKTDYNNLYSIRQILFKKSRIFHTNSVEKSCNVW